jgi:prevent-host-death family protein
MQLHQAIKPISHVKAHAAAIIRDVAETGNPVVITQNGEAKAVLIDVREYDSMRESLAMLKMLAVSSREVKQGKTRDADDVFADLQAKLVSKGHAQK